MRVPIEELRVGDVVLLNDIPEAVIRVDELRGGMVAFATALMPQGHGLIVPVGELIEVEDR